MKYPICILCLLLCLPLAAQTKVTKKIAARGNEFGITYSLPKTSLVIQAEVIKTVTKAGPYYRYAEKYLGVKNAVGEDKTSFRLGRLTLAGKGIPDAENTYIAEFKPGTTAPYAYLTEDGLICTINADYDPSENEKQPLPPTPSPPSPEEDDHESPPAFSEELLMAGSVARQAEVAAKQIYRIRESRLNILTGEADNLPPDGEAMKVVIRELDRQEKALTALFTGTSVRETSSYDLTLIPYENLEREVLFRFSERLGIVDADDLSGAPVYLSLKALDPPPVGITDPKEAARKEKARKGIVYNVPGKAGVEIQMNRQSLLKAEIPVVQFGYRENLAPALFEDKKKPVRVYFYPETGAIRQIIQ
ncbi:MAG: DUF4831 family protein [Tannerellaceae bacterium]|jgi:hypothetical protein|nr:DUF4831 family protein [Tannerellaceae bacterium]